MHRLFVALRPPPTVRAALLDVAHGVAGVRWQDDAQLHLTLRFLGEVDRRTAEDVALALSRVAASRPTVALDGVGRFAKRGGDILFARVAPAAPLTALHHKVDQALARAGVARDTRAYLPHITLARVPRAAAIGEGAAIDRWIARHAGLTSAAFTFDHLTLFESLLTPDGAQYETIARWPLLPPPGASHPA